jgi:demethylmenaquinone methyltransferase/2-methoxy-6-polyprenyl-1,4-benzoquinol methylase
MSRTTNDTEETIHTYRKRSLRYDFTVRLFNLFGVFGFNILAWRREAIQALDLKRGDTVVDIGCGTGLNFPLLQEAIGPEGQIIGVDLSDAMLDRARRRAAENDWENVELVCADAAQYEFPVNLGGVLSTFALVLVPECGQVVSNGCNALAPGRRLVVLDMAWPAGWPLWWRHVLFFLRSYGVTGEVLKGRPWETVWETMEQCLADVTRKTFWMGFFYLATGMHGPE